MATQGTPTTSPTPKPAAAPTRPSERIVEIDVLRGFAIFGILVVNVIFFAAPVYREVLDVSWSSPVDRWADGLVTLLAEGKFYTLFSLLFGLGLALQLERARAKGVAFVPRYVRRLLVLLAFGLAHALLLWWGDILTYYAVLGFVLLANRHAAPRTLVRRAVLLAALPLVLLAALTGLTELATVAPDGGAQMESSLEETRAMYRDFHQQAQEVYRGSDPLAMIPQRIGDWGFATIGTLLNGLLFLVLAMFLLGLAVGKLRIPYEIAAHVPLLRRTVAWGFVLGAVGNVAYLLLASRSDGLTPGVLELAATAAYVVGAPALSLAYASGLVLLMQRPAWRARLMPLSAVGRTALSNYLLQTLVMTTLVYGYGFGLYGRIGPATGLLIALVLFGLQVPLSVWWVRRFRFGPFEWAWRSLTYGRAQPMRPSSASQRG